MAEVNIHIKHSGHDVTIKAINQAPTHALDEAVNTAEKVAKAITHGYDYIYE